MINKVMHCTPNMKRRGMKNVPDSGPSIDNYSKRI